MKINSYRIPKAVVLLLFLIFSNPSNAQIWQKAQWIWQSEEGPNDSWTSFRKNFSLSKQPSKAIASIAVDSKYWMYINGVLVVREGGLKRGPNPTDSWYEEVDIQKYLRVGDNNISILVWYWGKREGDYYKSYNPSGKGGLVFFCDLGEKTIASDSSWKVKQNPAYGHAEIQPNNMKPEASVLFDANLNIDKWTTLSFDDSKWKNAIEKGLPPVAPWGKLHEREIPQWKDSELKNYTDSNLKFPFLSNGESILVHLPTNLQVYPYFKVEAKAGEKIIVRAEDTKEKNLVLEYITKEGIQDFEMPNWINGHIIKYEIPKGIKVLELKYRATQYDTEIVGDFNCNDPYFNTLWQKATRTLVVCLRDTYMDCPDRERAQWWGDVTLQMGAGFYSLDRNVDKLSKKAIYDLIGWQKADGVLSSPIPYSKKNNELTTQMLASIGPDGFWLYYKYTGDAKPVIDAYPAAKKYLELWSMGENGLVAHRKAGWDWGDWGTNIDKPILENCWYYWACKAAVDMAKLSGNTQDIDWYQKRIASIDKNFDTIFWNGNEYKSETIWMDKPSIDKGVKPIADERANAMAVIIGLASKEKYPKIAEVLKNNINAGPYMEKYVDQALFVMGYPDAALDRLKKRYQVMVDLPQTTLYETFPKGGTMNHAWNAPNTLLSEFVAGIAPISPGFETYKVIPQLGKLTSVNANMLSVKGMIDVSINKKNSTFELNLTSPTNTIAVVGIPKNDKTVSEIKVNGKVVWDKSGFKNSVSAVTWNGDDADYIKFNVTAGKWEFLAK